MKTIIFSQSRLDRNNSCESKSVLYRQTCTLRKNARFTLGRNRIPGLVGLYTILPSACAFYLPCSSLSSFTHYLSLSLSDLHDPSLPLFLCTLLLSLDLSPLHHSLSLHSRPMQHSNELSLRYRSFVSPVFAWLLASAQLFQSIVRILTISLIYLSTFRNFHSGFPKCAIYVCKYYKCE